MHKVLNKIFIDFVIILMVRMIRMVNTALKMNISTKDFFSKCYQIRSFLRNWSHLLKKSLVENLIFCVV